MAFIDELNSFPCGKKDLRKFGLTMAAAFAILGGLLLWRGKAAAPVFFLLAALFLVPGLAFPQVLKPIHRAWMALAILLGSVMTRLILFLTFYLMITPLGLLMRLFGYRFLDLSWGDTRETFWHFRPDQEPQAKHYERQF